MDGWNYFSYYSEIEEYFWKKRGAHLLVSPLDWAIMESWQKAGVPLSAVLKGIDRAFESYQKSRRGAGRPLKSLAYCTDAVLEAAVTTHADEELMVRLRRELDRQLAAYRSKLKAEQLRQVERQYLQKRLFEEFGLPRLSLYYFS